MGVQVAVAGKRRFNAELNLVPFIDLMSVLIVFLLATVVWVQFESLPVDQAVGGGIAVASPPLAIRLSRAAAWVGRDRAGTELPALDADFDWRQIEALLALDRRGHADAAVVISAEDGVDYGAVVRALDLARLHGYTEPELASP